MLRARAALSYCCFLGEFEARIAHLRIPFAHCRVVRTTNHPLEWIIREIRRRTRVVGVFPDGDSAPMLVAARLRHLATTPWGQRRYRAMERLLNPPKPEQEAAA